MAVSNRDASSLDFSSSLRCTDDHEHSTTVLTHPYDRRSILKLSLASAGLLMGTSSHMRRAPAFGRREQIGVTFLAHGDGAKSRPRAAEQLMWEVSKRTSIGVREAPRWVSPESPNLLEDPLLVDLLDSPGPRATEGALVRDLVARQQRVPDL